MYYLKIFIKKNALILLYSVYVICVIYFGCIVDYTVDTSYNIYNDKVKDIQFEGINKKTITNISDKEEVAFYDTKNPLVGAIAFLFIELICIYFK
jgi:hypothetical protein